MKTTTMHDAGTHPSHLVAPLAQGVAKGVTRLTADRKFAACPGPAILVWRRGGS